MFLSFFLIISARELFAKERKHGAKLVVEKKNGEKVKGELIAVKLSGLLLLDESGLDISLNTEDIQLIKILKKSRIAENASMGVLVGAGLGALLGSSSISAPSG